MTKAVVEADQDLVTDGASALTRDLEAAIASALSESIESLKSLTAWSCRNLESATSGIARATSTLAGHHGIGGDAWMAGVLAELKSGIVELEERAYRTGNLVTSGWGPETLCDTVRRLSVTSGDVAILQSIAAQLSRKARLLGVNANIVGDRARENGDRTLASVASDVRDRTDSLTTLLQSTKDRLDTIQRLAQRALDTADEVLGMARTLRNGVGEHTGRGPFQPDDVGIQARGLAAWRAAGLLVDGSRESSELMKRAANVPNLHLVDTTPTGAAQ